MSTEKPKSDDRREPAVAYQHTTDMSAFLDALGISLIVTTYQAQRIMTFAPNGPKLYMLMRVFERPTGMAISGDELAMVAKKQIWFFERAADLRTNAGEAMPYDLCYVPRRSHITGDIAGHECFYQNGVLNVINSRFSCFCTLESGSSFVPGWKPPFVTEYVPEDRCHLNGVATDGTGARYVTALGKSDTAEGWRENRTNGGIILDVPSGEIVSAGISMPHSPRLYGGKLWVLESGLGELQMVDPANGQRTTVAALPGYLRGLAFFDRFAFVGLCKIREKRTFGGLAIEERAKELKCAIYAIDLSSGQVAGFIEFTKGIEELFDIIVLPRVRKPHIIGMEDDTIDGLYVLP